MRLPAQMEQTNGKATVGFLEGAARDGYHVVRLELHDAPPPDDRADWPDLVETPHVSRTGVVGLTYVTGGPRSADLHLGEPGRYAIRIGRRRTDSSDDEWCLRFWPDPEGSTVDLPRWLARREPATGPGRDGWDELIPLMVRNVVSLMRLAAKEAGGATVEQIDAWCRKYRREAGWLDAPLFPDPPAPLPAGHADLDARAAQARQENLARLAREAADLADVAGPARRTGAGSAPRSAAAAGRGRTADARRLRRAGALPAEAGYGAAFV